LYQYGIKALNHIDIYNIQATVTISTNISIIINNLLRTTVFAYTGWTKNKE